MQIRENAASSSADTFKNQQLTPEQLKMYDWRGTVPLSLANAYLKYKHNVSNISFLKTVMLTFMI